MRQKQTENETFFSQKVEEYISKLFNTPTKREGSITDNPDALFIVGEKRIAVELSQIPSDYIVRHFHRKQAQPYHKDKFTIERVIFPYEPHIWVHDVATRKKKRANSYKKSANADEIWLAIHSPRIQGAWPMSMAENQDGRKYEVQAMAFGVKHSSSKFDRILFVYADGHIEQIHGPGTKPPKKIGLSEGSGYPTVTTHLFTVGLDSPLQGLGERTYNFRHPEIIERIVKPKDSWMSKRPPDVKRPTYEVEATVATDKFSFAVLEDGVRTPIKESLTAQNGTTSYLHILVQQGPAGATFHITP